MMNRIVIGMLAIQIALYPFLSFAQTIKAPFTPSYQDQNHPFDRSDESSFLSPPKVDYPETWFHFIGGNVSKEGITADLEAIAKARFSGVHLFHGQFGGPWPGVDPQIACLSPQWDDAVKHAATECRKLGLKFLMNNTPGWATSGGPWIKPSNAMRTLIWSRTDISGGKRITQQVPLPQPSSEPWRDYKDIIVLAFPTPDGDTITPILYKGPFHMPAAKPGQPNQLEIPLPDGAIIRTVEFPAITTLNYPWSYDPAIRVMIQAVLADGTIRDVANITMPESNFEDDQPVSIACAEARGAVKYRIIIDNKHNIDVSSIRLLSAARQNNWESEAAWSLRSIVRPGVVPQQSSAAFINADGVLDLSDKLDKAGNLVWDAPEGHWTILRFGHVNKGQKNGPAPEEATGWEANKFAKSGAEAQFAGYIGRLAGKSGPLSGGLLDGMLIDSWECRTQSWTDDMQSEFERVSGYSLQKWLPALLGYVVRDQETTARFLTDWRRTLNDLFMNNFYGRMASLAHASGLHFTFETAAGDVLPGDILEYFKFADVPMCEFWQPMTDSFVGSLNFKPVKPTVSAARIYGKSRVAAESFTSFDLTWDEHFGMLREVANFNAVQGVTHFVFHTYTHNPEKPFLPPGTSFGAGIGTPFLRGQTWWPYMPEFNTYLARCTYLLERGHAVSDVLWYLGDEVDHKPDQNAPFPAGYKYDYCNPDVLLNRLAVHDGLLTTPEGLTYRLLWLPNARRMLPETLEKIYALAQQGAAILGDAPVAPATLSGGPQAQSRFDELVKKIWGSGGGTAEATGGESGGRTGGATSGEAIRKLGRGWVFMNISVEKALAALRVAPDVIGGDAPWLHRQAEGTNFYFITPPPGHDFNGTLSFRSHGNVELWDPVTGTSSPVKTRDSAGRTMVRLDLTRTNACFLVFRSTTVKPPNPRSQKLIATRPIAGPWTISFPAGWGISGSQTVTELKPWKELNSTAEGKAFSGTATYTTSFEVKAISPNTKYVLDLGNVDMVASVTVNGKKLGDILAAPYRIDLKDAVHPGANVLEVKVTSTWFNRLVYDAGQPASAQKTWVINGPPAASLLRNSGLLGPVVIEEYQAN